MSTLLGLHGYSLNGTLYRSHLQPLLERLPSSVTLEFPDGPHVCAEASVARLYAALGTPRLPPPHHSWWDASEDGRVYHDWDKSLALLRNIAEQSAGLGVIGFSQGAMVAAVLAGLASRGEFPNLRYVVIIAGRTPRAETLRPLFEQKLNLPSLHVWGERDPIATPAGAELAEHFDPAQREVWVWPGSHRVPTRGAAADKIVAFVERYA
jgi:predicted esterase